MKNIFKLGRQAIWLMHRDYLIEKHELDYLFWECTLNCNFQCKHCGSNAGEKFLPETLKTEEIKKAFLNVAQNFNPKKINIAVTGGEPLLRKDLFEVMGYASSLGFNWGMVSNGYLTTPESVVKAKEAKMRTIDISIDGTGDVHDEFRNKKGSYKKAIEAIKLYQEADFLSPIRITTTVHSKSIETLGLMYADFLKLGIKKWRLLGVDPIGRANKNNESFLDKDQYIKLLQFVKDKRKNQQEINISFGCAHYLGDDFEDEVRNNFFYCRSGISVASILHNGDIFVCPNVPRKNNLIQGNIKVDNFSDVWKNKFKYFRDKNRTVCEKCENCDSWDNCLGGALHSWDFDENKQKFCILR